MSNMGNGSRDGMSYDDEEDSVEMGRGFDGLSIDEKKSIIKDESENLLNEFKYLVNAKKGGYTFENDDSKHIVKVTRLEGGKKVDVFESKDGHAKFSRPIEQDFLDAYFKAQADVNPKKDIIVNSCNSLEDARLLAKAAKDNNMHLVFSDKVLENLKSIDPKAMSDIEDMLKDSSSKRFKM